VSKLKLLLCYESQHQSQSNEKSVVQFDYEKAVSNYSGTQSTFKVPASIGHYNVRILFFILFLPEEVCVSQRIFHSVCIHSQVRLIMYLSYPFNRSKIDVSIGHYNVRILFFIFFYFFYTS